MEGESVMSQFVYPPFEAKEDPSNVEATKVLNSKMDGAKYCEKQLTRDLKAESPRYFEKVDPLCNARQDVEEFRTQVFNNFEETGKKRKKQRVTIAQVNEKLDKVLELMSTILYKM